VKVRSRQVQKIKQKKKLKTNFKNRMDDVFALIAEFSNMKRHAALVVATASNALRESLKRKRTLFRFMTSTYHSAPWRAAHPLESLCDGRYNYSLCRQWQRTTFGLRYDRKVLQRFVVQLYDPSEMRDLPSNKYRAGEVILRLSGEEVNGWGV